MIGVAVMLGASSLLKKTRKISMRFSQTATVNACRVDRVIVAVSTPPQCSGSSRFNKLRDAWSDLYLTAEGGIGVVSAKDAKLNLIP